MTSSRTTTRSSRVSRPRNDTSNLTQGVNVDNDTVTVEQTNNYSLFNFIDNNRDRNRGHIENLKRAFEENGNLTKVQPILVNDRMQIIDGQHRYIAAKELDLPIFYTVVPGLGISDARQMNILHKTWNTDDFAHSYADGGDANYSRYLQLREDYGVSHSIILYYVAGKDEKGAMAGFRNGEFTLTPEQLTETRARLDKLAEVAEVVPNAYKIEFAIALLKCMSVDGYDHQRMLSKLERTPEIPRYASVLDYQRALEDIYNRGVSDSNRVRLF